MLLMGMRTRSIMQTLERIGLQQLEKYNRKLGGDSTPH
jgi:hypothetical protein